MIQMDYQEYERHIEALERSFYVVPSTVASTNSMTEAIPMIQYHEELFNLSRVITCHQLVQQYEKAPV